MVGGWAVRVAFPSLQWVAVKTVTKETNIAEESGKDVNTSISCWECRVIRDGHGHHVLLGHLSILGFSIMLSSIWLGIK